MFLNDNEFIQAPTYQDGNVGIDDLYFGAVCIRYLPLKIYAQIAHSKYDMCYDLSSPPVQQTVSQPAVKCNSETDEQ